jgi:GntR family transcriptional repressor for pyruvate dehydrogenase complex
MLTIKYKNGKTILKVYYETTKMQKSLPFKALKKTRLYEDVAGQIKQAIYEGHLKPGDRLPSERKLCEMFDVGRPTVREALRTLSVLGLVKINHGSKGSTVRDHDITQYMEAIREELSWLIKVEGKTLEDLWEVRKYIELGIAHSAATNATKKDLRKLDRLLKKMESSRDDIHAYFPMAVEFHQELALSTKNKIFYLVWEMFHDILLKGYVPILGEIFPDGSAKLFKANKALLNAIKSKVPNAIDEAMETHAEEEKFFSALPHGRKVD